MARSVSAPYDAILVAYQAWDCEDAWEFDDNVDALADAACNTWPSFTPCAEWLGREDRAIAENSVAWFGLSEYCGLVAVWIAPKSGCEGLARGFATRIAGRFYRLFGAYRRIGVFSNGEAFYERIEA